MNNSETYEYSISCPKDNFAQKCRQCETMTISMPLQILHADGGSLCSQCSEIHTPALHEVLHLYLSKYPHHLQALCTQDEKNYSLIYSYNQKPENEFNYRCTLGTELCHLADHYSILSFYYYPQSHLHAIANIKKKENAPEISSAESDYIIESFLHVYGPETINMFFMIDKNVLDFDEEWRFIFPDGKLIV